MASADATTLETKWSRTMVWGLENPVVFGVYRPNGDFIGRIERLDHYFKEEMTAEQRAEFDNNPAGHRLQAIRKYSEEGRGPIAPHELLKEFKFKNIIKSLRSFVSLGGIPAVDEILKQIIESLEPGVHQFLPIRLIQRNGEDYPASYFVLVIGRFLDSIVPEQSDVQDSMGSFFAHRPSEIGYKKIAVSQSVIGGAHIWRERRLDDPYILMSDVLQAEIARQGLKILQHYKLKAI